MFWGDSYVEALHVSDSEKMTSFLNNYFIHEHIDRAAVNMGSAGQDIAYYFYQISAYEKIIPDIKEHIIVLCGFDDICPASMNSQSGEKFPRIIYSPELSFAKGDLKSIPVSQQKKRLFVAKYGLQFFKLIAVELIGSHKANRSSLLKSLRFSVGTAKQTIAPEAVLDESATNVFACEIYWHDLIPVFKKCTEKPITFLYIPHVPYIENGKIVSKDNCKKLADVFKNVCDEYDCKFINAEQYLLKMYEREGRLPFGFHNSYPGRGHLNQYGHKAVAQAVFDFLCSKGDLA